MEQNLLLDNKKLIYLVLASSVAFLLLAGAGYATVVMTLNSPANDAYDYDGSVDFQCTQAIEEVAKERHIINVTLWGEWNSSGNWNEIALNGTADGQANNTAINFSNIALANGNWKWNCHGTDNESDTAYASNYTLHITIGTPAADSGGGGGEEIRDPMTVTMALTSSDPEDSASLILRDTVDLTVDGQSYTVTVNKLVFTTVTFSINPVVEATIKSPAKVDLDGDGSDDLQISISRIKGGFIDATFTRLAEVAAPAPTPEVEDEVVTPPAAEEEEAAPPAEEEAAAEETGDVVDTEGPSMTTYAIVALVVIVLLGFGYYYSTAKTKKTKTRAHKFIEDVRQGKK